MQHSTGANARELNCNNGIQCDR